MGRAALRLGELSIEGSSRAGDETWFRIHPPGLAFDTGRGARELAGSRDIFLSHGHLDHALGLPYVLSQRSLHHEQDTRVFCPAEIAGALADLVAAAERLEGGAFRYEIFPLGAGSRVEVGRDLAVEAFATAHVVPSLGFHLWRRKRRLAAAFAGLSPAELAAGRERGIDPSEVIEEIWLTYCGDTGPELFALEPRVFASRVLLIECTFLGDEERGRGDRYKHLHLEDLARHAHEFGNDALVLHHLSRRHSVDELRAAVERQLPELAARVHFLVESEVGVALLPRRHAPELG